MNRRIIAIISILALIVAPAMAQDNAQSRYHVISSFAKGQNSHHSPFTIGADQGIVDQNVRVNDTYNALSKRELLLQSLDYGTGPITSIHRYYKADATQQTIVSLNTLLRADFSGTATTIKTGLTDGKRWQWVTYKDIAIGVSAFDQPVKFDGHILTTANTDAARTAGELAAELGSCFAELDTGTDLDASKWYQYKVVWFDDATYDFSTAVSNPILTGAAVYNIRLTGIPIGPTGTTHRYLYRTSGEATQAALATATYYMVWDISNNTATTQDDNVSDTTLETDRAPTVSTATGGTDATPPKGAIATIYNERLFISGNVDDPSDVYWSDSFNPDHFLPTDFESIRPDDGDKVTGLKSQLGVLAIIKTNTIQKFYTDGTVTANWILSDPFSEDIGSPAPYTIKTTPLGIFFLSRKGIWRFTGQSVSLVSDAVTDVINDISQTDIENAVGHYLNNEYMIAYISTATGSSTNNRVLIYDIIRDAYVTDTKEINCFASFNSGTDLGILFSGTSISDGVTVAHSGTADILVVSTDSDFELGTFDDTRSRGTEANPILELSWDCDIDGWLAELQTKNASINTINDIGTYLPDAIIDRPDTDGTWESPVYFIGASTLDQIQWNETLGQFGDVTFQIRLAATSGAVSGESYSTAVTDPNGSDISGITGNNYIQVRINLSTTDIDFTPELTKVGGFVWRIIYSKIGSAYETSILSIYQSGWLNFGIDDFKKLIRKVKIFYAGTSGTLNLNMRNGEGDIDRDIPIDLSISPSADSEDGYRGAGDMKIFTFNAPVNSETVPSMVGEYWQYTLTEEGSKDWTVYKILTGYELQELYAD